VHAVGIDALNQSGLARLFVNREHGDGVFTAFENPRAAYVDRPIRAIRRVHELPAGMHRDRTRLLRWMVRVRGI
jgi:hypothetical protein